MKPKLDERPLRTSWPTTDFSTFQILWKHFSENKLKATLSKSRHQYDIACDMVKLIEQGKLQFIYSSVNLITLVDLSYH